MSNLSAKIPPEFQGLSMEDRIRRVQELWDFIAQTPDEVPVPERHKRILDTRLSEYEADGNKGTPWSEVRDRLLRELRRD